MKIMKKTLLYTLCSLALTANGLAAWGQSEGVYQIPNSDFETWANEKEPGNGWNSFNSATGSLNTFKGSSPAPGQVVGHNGIGVKLTSKNVVLANANGNLTTGIINMGSMTPTNAANYNYTKRDDASHSLKFAGMPDAAECYATFKSGGSPNGRLQFIIHGDINYCDPETSNSQQNSSTDYKVASAAILIPACTEWTKFTAEFQYTGNDKTPNVHYMLASATTNPTPGGSKGDELCLDDVKLIYYHSLTNLKYEDNTIDDFSEEKLDYDLSSEKYEESKLTYEKKGVGATVEKSYNEETGKLTITVKGNDWEMDNTSQTEYTIQFAKPKPEEVKFTKDYTEELYVTIDGQTVGPQSTPVTVQTRYDGKINFLLKNFALEGMYIGNINVDGLDVEDGKFSCQDKSIEITAGDLEGVEENQWMGPTLSQMDVKANMEGRFVGDNNIKVSLSILFGGMNINVHLGYTPTIANMTVGANKYGTFYAPFAVTLPGDVKAYTCESLNNGSTLVLTSVDGGEISANTAVIVESTNGTSQDFYNFEEGLKVEDGNTGLLHGVATGGKAPVGSYVLQTQEGKGQKFYLVTTDNLQVSANRCYLQLPASSGVKAISFPSDPTAIDGVKELLSGKAEIYDLEGRRLPALQKGINIVGGKKVMVK